MDLLRTYSPPVSSQSSDPGVKRVRLYPLADLHRLVNGNGGTGSGDRIGTRPRPPGHTPLSGIRTTGAFLHVTRTEAKPMRSSMSCHSRAGHRLPTLAHRVPERAAI